MALVMAGITGCAVQPDKGTSTPMGLNSSPVTTSAVNSPTQAATSPVGPQDVAAQMRASIVAEQGWGVVRIGAKRSDVEALLGKPDEENPDPSDPDSYLYCNYTGLGVSIDYAARSSKVADIAFVNGATDMVGVGHFGSPDYTPFKGETDRGANWHSTPGGVKKLYGKPLRAASDDSNGHANGHWIEYQGITFYFWGDNLKIISVWSD